MEMTRGEIVEAEFDRLISKRHDQCVAEESERPAREMWQESEIRYEANRRRENRAAWYGGHLDQAERHRRTLKGLIAHHEARAERLCYEDRGEGIR